MPSDMDLYIGTINGYNNLMTIATDDLQLGFNDDINEEQQIQQYPDDFELVSDDPPLQAGDDQTIQKELINKHEAIQKEPINEAMQLQQEESL